MQRNLENTYLLARSSVMNINNKQRESNTIIEIQKCGNISILKPEVRRVRY